MSMQSVLKAVQIILIAVHKGLHLDEIAAIWLLRKFGKERYPGINDANITIWNYGGGAPDDQSAEEWEERGVLAVGVGLGKYDEHALEGNKTECAASLVAKDLGVVDDPALREILAFVTRADLTGGNRLWDMLKKLKKLLQGGMSDAMRLVLRQAAGAVGQANIDSGNVKWALPQLVKDLNILWPDEPERVIEWACVALEARYQQQLRFVQAEEAYPNVSSETVVQGRAGDVRVVSVISDSDQMKAVALKRGADVIVQRVARGNVQVFTRRNSDLNVDDLARAIRFEEQYVRGVVVTTDFEALAEEGVVPGAECWYYHPEGGMLLNGSLSHENMEPTQVSLERIVELVVLVADVNRFDPDFEHDCQKGWCKSTSTDQLCPLFPCGLHRCRKIRWEMYQKRTS